MTIAPNRRWFQFSLATLFVAVTIACCWLGYELNWIRQRNQMLSRASHLAVPVPAPSLLWLFGSEGYKEIDVVLEDRSHDSARKETKRLADLFPEADSISVYGDRNTW